MTHVTGRQDETNYQVVSTNYLLGGGDGYELGEAALERHIGPLDTDRMKEKFSRNEPVTANIEGRIEFVVEREGREGRRGKEKELETSDANISARIISTLVILVFIVEKIL